MRADWATNFCRLMHWPVGRAANIDRIDGRDAIVVLKDGSRLQGDDFESTALADLLRASLVLGVSSLDAYFHSKIIAYVVRAANQGGDMPGALKKATITVEDFVEGRRYTRRMTTVRNSLDESLGFQTLQQPDKIANGLALIGVAGFWANVAARMEVPQEGVKSRLSQIVKRRNQIAHEGDVSQSRRTRNASREIDTSYVRQSLGFIRKLIKRSDDEINEQIEI